MTIEKSKDGKIHIGLALAGAITAGAFTAGVLDYLFNTIRLWHEAYDADMAKDKNDRKGVPKPNVVIDVITGSSAGSVVAATTLLSLISGKLNSPLSDGKIKDKINSDDNLLYYLWVNFGLTEKERIIDKLLLIDDLKTGEVRSLINTEFIDKLVESLKEKIGKKGEENKTKWTEYIAPNLNILMTLTNLRGIPIDLRFAPNVSNVTQVMSYHKAFAHFELNKNTVNDATLPLNINEKREFTEGLDHFIRCARASSAFPLALKSVPIYVKDKNYIGSNLKKIFGENIDTNNLQDNYEFLAVDGGMTNNEPLAETKRILEEKLGEDGAKNAKIILIDPFPFIYEEDEYCIENNSVMDIVKPLFKSLRNQTLFKEKDLVSLLRDSKTQNMIWPTRKKDDGSYEKNAIATGALDGFAGFLHRDYRRHDYFLGMKNCQNFLRYYFNRDAEAGEWSIDMSNKFEFIKKDEEGEISERKLPYIPDFRITSKHMVEAKEKNTSRTRFLNRLKDVLIKEYQFPTKYRDDIITKDLEKKIRTRVNAVTNALSKQAKLNIKYKIGIFFIGILIKPRKKLAEMIIQKIEDGLAKQGLLKDRESSEEKKKGCDTNKNDTSETRFPPIANR